MVSTIITQNLTRIFTNIDEGTSPVQGSSFQPGIQG